MESNQLNSPLNRKNSNEEDIEMESNQLNCQLNRKNSNEEDIEMEFSPLNKKNSNEEDIEVSSNLCSIESKENKDFELFFDFGEIDGKKYGRTEISGHFSLMNSYMKFVDIQKIDYKEEEDKLIDWVIKILKVTDGQRLRCIKNLKFTLLSMLTNPDIPPENLKLCSYSLVYSFLLNDIMENLNRTKQYEMKKEIARILILVIERNFTSLNGMPILNNPLLQPLCKAIMEMHQEVIKNDINLYYYISGMTNHVNAQINKTLYYNKIDDEIIKDKYKFMQTYSIFTSVWLEINLIIRGISLSEEIREHPFYKQICYESFLHTALINDIIFLKKKIDDEQIDNLVLIKCKKHSLWKSIQKVVKEINDLIIAIRDTTSKLSKYFFHDHNFNIFIKIIEFILDANVCWNVRVQSQIYKSENSQSTKQEAKMPAVEKSFLMNMNKSPIENAVFFFEYTGSILGFQSLIGKSRKLLNPTHIPYLELYSTSIIVDLLKGTQIHPRLLNHLQKFLAKECKLENYKLFKEKGKIQDELSLEYFLSYLCNLKTYNFFGLKGIIQDDVNTTALCASVLFGVLGENQVKAIAKQILQNVNEEGIIETYFPPRKGRENRIDPTVCASAMRLIYKVGYDKDAKKTENYLYYTLATKSYLEGSKYFPSPDTFLYYLYKAIILSKDALNKFGALLAVNVIDRLGTTNYPLDLAMRILIVEGLGLLKHEHMPEIINKEKQTLEKLQQKDGSWPIDALYKTGRSEIYFGSREISTAFSLKVLYVMKHADLIPHKPFLCDICQIIKEKKDKAPISNGN
ncbi:6996_t:CDS:1 [Scutellospora calospora]|uniref:6996_t:CDS:1 n=1 Tax=Scutellospora calospora TaxID=85575 RepID=A0ACA9K5R0_9GLOM|nr:6996_t:CDS:1 [Scutellospora calospora]